MKRSLFFHGAVMALMTVCLPSCSDEDTPDPITPSSPVHTEGMFVLNEGQYSYKVEGSLNLISYPDFKVSNNLFATANQRSIGDTPQCGVRYGSKIYLGIYGSNTIEVISASDYKSIKQIRLDASTTGTAPRAMITDKGNVYISMFDGYIARLDTTSLEINGRVKVGPNPETPAILGNRMYVPNSDGMNYLVGYGETASIINMDSFTVENTINVPLNPEKFMAVESRLFLLARGNYADVEYQLFEIDPNIADLQKKDPKGGWKKILNATMATAGEGKIYYIDAPYDKPEMKYGVYDLASDSSKEWTPAEVVYPNAIGVDPEHGDIYIGSLIMDGIYPSYTAPGFVAVYDKNFNFKAKAEVGAGRSSFFPNRK